MRSYHYLTPEQIAEYYVTFKGGPRSLPKTATALHLDVLAYLRTHGLGHRTDDAVDVAIAAHEITQQAQAQAAPDPSEFEANVREGTTADDESLRRAEELMLAGQVAQMSPQEYAANRERLGVSQNLGDFLGGSAR